MRRAKRSGFAVLLALIGSTAMLSAEPAADKIAVKPISYADLGKLVRSQRGKVVVVDVWSLG
jgi:hypothetical protein